MKNNIDFCLVLKINLSTKICAFLIKKTTQMSIKIDISCAIVIFNSKMTGLFPNLMVKLSDFFIQRICTNDCEL